MKHQRYNFTWSALLSSILVLAGCGGGGGSNNGSVALRYSGNTAPASVNASNAGEIGATVTEAATQSIQDGEFSEPTPFGVVLSDDSSGNIRQQVNNIVKRISDDLPKNNALPVGIRYTSDDLNEILGNSADWFCGGSLDGPALDADSGTLTFYNLCFNSDELGGTQIFMNGSMSFAYSESDNGKSYTDTTTYTNFKVTINGETHTLNGTETCTGNDKTFEYSCADLYTGTDGNTYQLSDSSYYGNTSSGYYVNATFYHPTHGSVEISTTHAITFNCDGAMPDSGTISYTGTGGSSGAVTFNNCTSYTITYNDGAGNAGTINGTW